MINIPGAGQTPPPPPQIPPRRGGKEEGRRVEMPTPRAGGDKGIMPMDSHAMAVRFAVLAAEAREKELSMAKIIEEAIERTGMTNPQSAMEEIDKRVQKEIEEVLEEIKSNKDLMEEAEAWQSLADLLESNLTKEQAEAFIQLVESQIKGMK